MTPEERAGKLYKGFDQRGQLSRGDFTNDVSAAIRAAEDEAVEWVLREHTFFTASQDMIRKHWADRRAGGVDAYGARPRRAHSDAELDDLADKARRA